MLHANLTALCFIEAELWPMKVLHCGDKHFRPFCSCELDVDQMTVYELDPYSLEIYRMCKMNFIGQVFRNLSCYSLRMRAFSYVWSLPVM